MAQASISNSKITFKISHAGSGLVVQETTAMHKGCIRAKPDKYNLWTMYSVLIII